MNFLVNIVLVLFLTFLATPTVVSVVEDTMDTTVVYDVTEEEVFKEVKESPMYIGEVFQMLILPVILKNAQITIENELKHDTVSEEIFSPPPELG